ncbi:signal peptidase complex subunit 1-like [Convolutriloba macropyga]|uniref:signal peptidase complex subunit 1-like n=1 Tax=Convolutriloba macropyga TaxID=536237 RepID=UPI003F51C384
MGDLLALISPKVDTFHDFKGQKKAERWFQIIHVVFAIFGFVWGYMLQRFSITVYSVLAAFVVSALVTLPPWPWFRRDPLKWQPKQIAVDSTPSKKKQKTKKDL